MKGPLPPGLDILNTGDGHTEITFNEKDPMEMERGKRIIKDMLKRGYLLFIEGDDGKLVKVKAFDESKGKYIIADGALYAGSEPLEPEQPKTRGRPRKAAVPMTSTRATAIGRSAGG